MSLERWLYRRNKEEAILQFPNIDTARHLSRQEEAEQEIEMIMRR